MPVITASNSAVVTTSGQKLIKRALRLIGALGVGKRLSSQELEDCQEAMNGMLDSWNTEKLIIPTQAAVATTVEPDQATYTIGPGGDIDTVRPQKIEQGRAFIRRDGIEYELNVFTINQWAPVWLKDINASIPCVIYYDAAYPLGNVTLWPKPDQADDLVLYLDSLLTQITDTSVPFQLPPGYVDAIVYNLAIALAPEYGKKAPAEVVARAIEAKGNVKRANMVPIDIKTDSALLDQCGDTSALFGGGGSSSMPTPDFLVVSTNYTLPEARWLVVEASGGAGITLIMPSPVRGNIVTIAKMDSDALGPVNMTGAGPQLPYSLVNQYQNVTFIADGAQWIVQASS